jgi:aryl-alcohol dehydrogenase-like predicted oxidoreductase
VQKNAPRLVGENLKTNEKLLERVKQMAERKRCTMNQLALAWVQHQGADVVPIPGTTKIANLDSNIASFRVQLSSEEL